MIFKKNKAENNQKKIQKQINFELSPISSFGPSQVHNSVNIGSKSTSRRTRAFIRHQD